MVALAQQFGADRFDHYVESDDGSLLLSPRDRENLNSRVAWLPYAERNRLLEEGWFRGPRVYDELDGAVIETAQDTSLRASDCLEGITPVVSGIRSFIYRHARAASIVGGLTAGASAAASTMWLWQR